MVLHKAPVIFAGFDFSSPQHPMSSLTTPLETTTVRSPSLSWNALADCRPLVACNSAKSFRERSFCRRCSPLPRASIVFSERPPRSSSVGLAINGICQCYASSSKTRGLWFAPTLKSPSSGSAHTESEPGRSRSRSDLTSSALPCRGQPCHCSVRSIRPKTKCFRLCQSGSAPPSSRLGRLLEPVADHRC
jgi:hypothetical protein